MEAILKVTEHAIKGELIFDEPMSKHTSWRTGGEAKRYFIAKDVDDLATMLKSMPDDEELFWLGLGSNTLVRDGGFSGTVIAMQGVAMDLVLKDRDRVEVGASVTCAKLAKFCAKNHLKGAGFFSGIPGMMGGALAMNAGAFGGETWRHVVSVETINRKGEINTRLPGEFEVNYRSVGGHSDEWFVSAVLKFEFSTDEKLSEDIKKLLAQRAVLQPIGLHSCGSVFKNPKGFHAAELIESCGLKGKRIGGAVVSEKHANFIINDKKATAEDIESLIRYVQKTVADQYAINLRTEVKIVGEHR